MFWKNSFTVCQPYLTSFLDFLSEFRKKNAGKKAEASKGKEVKKKRKLEGNTYDKDKDKDKDRGGKW